MHYSLIFLPYYLQSGGLLSVIVDAYLSGMLYDALIVPVAINYDKLVDGNFITEQLGQSKVTATHVLCSHQRQLCEPLVTRNENVNTIINI